MGENGYLGEIEAVCGIWEQYGGDVAVWGRLRGYGGEWLSGGDRGSMWNMGAAVWRRCGSMGETVAVGDMGENGYLGEIEAVCGIWVQYGGDVAVWGRLRGYGGRMAIWGR